MKKILAITLLLALAIFLNFSYSREKVEWTLDNVATDYECEVLLGTTTNMEYLRSHMGNIELYWEDNILQYIKLGETTYIPE